MTPAPKPFRIPDDIPQELDARTMVAGSLCNDGAALMAQGRIPEAASHFQAAILIDPTMPQPRINLAQLLCSHAKGGDRRGHQPSLGRDPFNPYT